MPAHITLPLQSQLILFKSLHNPINIIVKMHWGAKDGRSTYEPKSSSTWFFTISNVWRFLEMAAVIRHFWFILYLNTHLPESHFSFVLFFFVCSPAVKICDAAVKAYASWLCKSCNPIKMYLSLLIKQRCQSLVSHFSLI